jgi:alpha-glucosidase
MKRSFALDELPVYVRAGAIVPLQPKMQHMDEKPVNPLILEIYPGAGGSTRIYDDAGNTLGYQGREFAWTAVRHSRTEDGAETITISPVEGSYPGMPERRAYEIRLVGSWPVESARVNGSGLSASAIRYDGNRTTAVITTPEFSIHDGVEIILKRLNGREELLDAAPGKIARVTAAMHILNGAWPKDWSPESLIRAAQTGERMRLRPESAQQELAELQESAAKITSDINAMQADAALKERALRHLEGIFVIPRHQAAYPGREGELCASSTPC